MATQFKITVEDKEEVYTVKPKHVLKIERESGGITANIESSYTLAWLATESKLSFDDWIDTVDDIEAIDTDEDAEVDAVNPTKGA